MSPKAQEERKINTLDDAEGDIRAHETTTPGWLRDSKPEAEAKVRSRLSLKSIFPLNGK